MVLDKKNNRLAYYLLLGLVLVNCNSLALALPNNSNNQSNVKSSQTDINTLEKSVKQRATAAQQEDWETVLRLTSRTARLQSFDGLFLLATFRGFDDDYKLDTESLKAKINELKRTTGISNRKDIVNASFAVQGAYYKTLYDSLKEIFALSKIQNIAGNISNFELKILSVKNDTAIAALIRHNGKNSVARFIKQEGQWLFATAEEVDAARLPQGDLRYVSPGLLPLAETVPFLSDKKQYTGTIPEWYDTLPPATAAEKNIKVGDIVLAYVEAQMTTFQGFRVIAIEKGDGDRATLIRQDNLVFNDIPLALLHKVEDYTDRDRQLQRGDLVFVSQWAGNTIARVSAIKDSQIRVKYVSIDEIEEEIPRGIVLPFPKSGYLFRKVAYRYDEDIEVGMVIAESENKVWIDTPSPSLGIVAVNKTDVKPIELPDADLRPRKVWTTTYKSIRKVKILRVIEPGLLYEIDEQNFDNEYRLLPFDSISLEEPSLTTPK